MTDTASLTPWLAVIAIATAVQALLFLGAAIMGLKAYRQATVAVDQFKQQQLNPLLARAHIALDNAEDIVNRVRSADDEVRRTFADTKAKASEVTANVRRRLWPVVGLTRGVRAAIQAFSTPRGAYSPSMTDDHGNRRLVHEGGTTHVRS